MYYYVNVLRADFPPTPRTLDDASHSARTRPPMTIQTLTEQFRVAQQNIGLGSRRKVAIAAHLEVRAVLHLATSLVDRGLVDVLIGSYPRRTGIWPGKDVDVFGKLTNESIDTIEPGLAYDLFLKVLDHAFPGRITPQDRSVKVAYEPDRLPATQYIREAARFLEASDVLGANDAFEFSVDVVPAVRFGNVWGIPNRNHEMWTRAAAAERWIRTNPEKLTDLTRQLNGKLKIGAQGAYVPTVKTVRQIRRTHLGDAKPGGLYFELIVHEGFTNGEIKGDSWAEITASTLRYIADRLLTVNAPPLCDPVLDQPYRPTPEPGSITHAAEVFAGLASDAERALTADQCPAAATWRIIFGPNSKVNGPVFELPTGCRSDGTVMPVFASTAVNPIRGTDEARGFGRD